MNINIEKITLDKKEILERLLQLYLHDISLYFPITFNSKTSKYEYDLDSYFDKNYAYFIKSNDDILGFILIDDNSNNNYEISEFFVLNNYKRRRVGNIAATKVFDLYKGNWTIKVVPSSPIAEAFWIHVVNDYTNGKFQLKHTGKYNRAELYFSNNYSNCN